jgi:hypothetical protein
MNEAAQSFKKALGQHLIIDDWQAIDIVLGLVASHKVGGEPMWTRIIGQSGSGKTEILRTLADHPDCEKLETLTPSAIRRGYVPENGMKLPTMLERINGKLVITKELAGMLTKDKDSRAEVFGLLRSVQDGELVADYGGIQGCIKQKSTFDWIMASTRYIDGQRMLDQQLGSRFMDLRWGAPLDRKSMVVQSMGNTEGMITIRDEMAESMANVVSSVSTSYRVRDMDADMLETIADIALAIAAMRGAVPRNYHTGEVDEEPDCESGTRPAQYLARLACGLHNIGMTDTAEIMKSLRRIAWDSLPPQRVSVLRAWIAGNKTQTDIAKETGLSQRQVSDVIDDMQRIAKHESITTSAIIAILTGDDSE